MTEIPWYNYMEVEQAFEYTSEEIVSGIQVHIKQSENSWITNRDYIEMIIYVQGRRYIISETQVVKKWKHMRDLGLLEISFEEVKKAEKLHDEMTRDIGKWRHENDRQVRFDQFLTNMYTFVTIEKVRRAFQAIKTHLEDSNTTLLTGGTLFDFNPNVDTIHGIHSWNPRTNRIIFFTFIDEDCINEPENVECDVEYKTTLQPRRLQLINYNFPTSRNFL